MATALLSSVEEDGTVRASAHVGIMQQWPVPFETSRRRDVLSFSHHREVALLPPEDADRWLDWAEEPLRDRGKPRSTRELRRQVRGQNAPRRRALNGSQTTSADVTDAISEGRRKLDSPGQTEPLQRLTLLATAAAWREDSPN